MADPVATCVWRVTPEVIIALADRLGDPVDTYVNGSQTWLRTGGPDGEVVEWRLHPVPHYTRPDGISHHEVFLNVAGAARSGSDGLSPGELWDGLEALPAYGDRIDPDQFRSHVTEVLGIVPDAAGTLDHDLVTKAWERSGGTASITDLLVSALVTTD